MSIKYLIVLASLTLVACASPSKKECQQMDWSSMGKKLGENGKSPDELLAKYKKSCFDQHAVQVNKEKFNSGYKLGLASFCTESLGYRAGNRGGKYDFPSVCPEAYEKKFKSGYEKGLNQFCSPSRFVEVAEKGLKLEYPSACGEERARSSAKAYQKGLRKYCTFEMGQRVGEKGESYLKVCPSKLEPNFLKGYELGTQRRVLNEISALSKHVQDLETEIKSKNSQIDELTNMVEGLQKNLSDRDKKLKELEIIK